MSFEYNADKLPPSLNRLWSVYLQNIYLTREARVFRLGVRDAWLKTKQEKMKGKLRCSYKMCAHDKRKRDLDNYCKAVLDACQNMGVIENDSNVLALEATKCECRHCPFPFTFKIE